MYYAGGSLLAVLDGTSNDLDKSLVAKFRAYEDKVGPKIIGEDHF